LFILLVPWSTTFSVFLWALVLIGGIVHCPLPLLFWALDDFFLCCLHNVLYYLVAVLFVVLPLP